MTEQYVTAHCDGHQERLAGRRTGRQDRPPSAVRVLVTVRVARSRPVLSLVFSSLATLLACVFLVLLVSAIHPPPVLALTGDSHSIDFDIEALAQEMETDPHLENFSSLGAEAQNEMEKGIASVEDLERLYNKASYWDYRPEDGYWTVSDAQMTIEDYEKELQTGIESLPSDGSAEAEIASEIEAEAEVAGVAVTSTLGVAVASIPVAASLAYEDYTDGTNVVYRALFGGYEDYSELHEAVAAEAFRWSKYKYFATSKFGCLESSENEIGRCIKDQAIEKWGAFEYGAHFSEEHLCPGDYGKEGSSAFDMEVEGSPVWILEPKVGGCWYIGAESNVLEGCYGPILGSNSPGFTGTCTTTWPWTSGYSIAGFPDHLHHNKVEWWQGQGEFEHECPSSSHEPACQVVVNVGEMRQNHYMHTGLPRETTPEHIAKLEAEGHEVRHGEAKEGTSETEPSIVRKAGEEMHKHGHKSQEKTECHYLQCETGAKESEPEERTDPAQPAKSGEIAPSIAGEAEIPSCFVPEITGGACKSLIESAGFTSVELDVLTWETAVVTDAAEATVSVKPGSGSTVETSSKIVVESNPDASSMPLTLPNPGTESADKYKERLEKEGWTKVEEKTATEPHTDVEPGQVARIDPEPGSRIDPTPDAKIDTDIEVEAQPEGSPEPGLPSGAGVAAPGCGLTPPSASIDLTPITSKKFTNVFPFSTLTWLSGSLSGIAATGREPHAVLHVFGSEVETGNGFAPLASIFTLFRTTIAAFLWLGVAWFLWNRTLGSRTS